MKSHELYAKPGLKLLYLISGISMLALGLVMLLTTGGGVPFGVSFVMIWVGVWMGQKPLMTLGPDHFELKLAPLAGLKIIAYRDVRQVVEKGRALLLRVTPNGGEPKNVKIPRKAFTPTDYAFIVNHLRTRSGAA